MHVTFKEKQKFTQWWLWLMLIGIVMIPIVGIYKQLILGEQFGSKPMSDVGLILVFVFMLCFLGLFWLMALNTLIDQHEIKVHFFPFVKKKVSWKDVKTADVVNYGFVGGWGIRLWTPHGTVYNTKGNIGLAIELTNGKKFLIGTQKETELKKVINKIKEQRNASR